MDPSLELRVDGTAAFSSSGRWLHPLFELEAAVAAGGIDPARGELFDKVVGRGSAFLIARLGIRRVHAGTLSRLGAEVLDRFAVEHSWDLLVDRIDCATEGLLEGVSDVEVAYGLLAERARAGKATSRPRVLFVCTHNSARSQMAEALARRLGSGAVEAASAGTEAAAVRPEAVAVMAELRIDISGQEPKTIDRFRGQRFDAVVTVCDGARESCPFFPASRLSLHWSVPDPAAVQGAGRLEAFRNSREELSRRIREELLPALGVGC